MGLIPAHRFYMSFTGLIQRLAIAANRRPSQAENISAQLALAVNPAYSPVGHDLMTLRLGPEPRAPLGPGALARLLELQRLL